jgi:NADPH-dependent 2,4-dienoyl-CoA reductase/sulfur reductase-like enzyme
MIARSDGASEACDVLVIGAGPAGLSAALAAAQSGASVILVDDNALPGGQIWRDGPHADVPAPARRLRAGLERQPNILLRFQTRVLGKTAEHHLLLEDPQSAWTVNWKKLILCTGARELLLPFPGWTLPGVTGAGALQALIKAGIAVRGERVVIAGSGPLLLAAAANARAAGAVVLRIAEQASLLTLARFALHLPRWPGKALQSLSLLHPSYRTSTYVLSASGAEHLQTVSLHRGRGREDIACDRLACGFGLVPNTELGQLLGCGLKGTGVLAAIGVDQWQATSIDSIYAAGECAGVAGSERAMAQGSIAGYSATGQALRAGKELAQRDRWDAFAQLVQTCFAPPSVLAQLPDENTLVCRCEDVTHAALRACSGWTDAKLHTRCGMGACQGRICGMAAQFLYGWSAPVPRMPLVPARIESLAALRPGPATAPGPE